MSLLTTLQFIPDEISHVQSTHHVCSCNLLTPPTNTEGNKSRSELVMPLKMGSLYGIYMLRLLATEKPFIILERKKEIQKREHFQADSAVMQGSLWRQRGAGLDEHMSVCSEIKALLDCSLPSNNTEVRMSRHMTRSKL